VCQGCTKQLSIPAKLLGKTVKCPKCTTMFQARPISSDDIETVRLTQAPPSGTPLGDLPEVELAEDDAGQPRPKSKKKKKSAEPSEAKPYIIGGCAALAVLVIAVCLYFFWPSSGADSWKVYGSQEGNFGIKFPTEPTTGVYAANIPGMGEIRFNAYVADDSDITVYVAAFADLPNSPLDDRTLVDRVGHCDLAGVFREKARITNTRDVRPADFGGYPGKEYVVGVRFPTEEEDSTAVVRVYAVKKRLYVLFVGSHDDLEASTSNVRSFFENFDFMDDPPDPKTDKGPAGGDLARPGDGRPPDNRLPPGGDQPPDQPPFRPGDPPPNRPRPGDDAAGRLAPPADGGPRKVPSAKDLPGLVCYWAFDEEDASKAGDSAGSLDGIIYGAGRTKGVRGNAYQGSNKDTFCELGQHKKLNFGAGAPFTITGWFQCQRPRIGFAGGVILSFRAEENQNPVIDIFVDRSGRFTGQVRSDDSSMQTNSVSSPFGLRQSVADGKWHHFALVRHPGGRTELFLDGVTLGEEDRPENRGAITTDLRAIGGELYWIKRSNGFGPHAQTYFDGLIDEVCVFNRALKVAEIQKLAGME
jgi:hypothetical protein